MKYKFPALIVKEEDGFVVEFPDLEDALRREIPGRRRLKTQKMY